MWLALWTFFGCWNGVRGIAGRLLLRAQLDAELFADGNLDVFAEREAPDHALALVRLGLQPLRQLPTAGVDVVVHAGGHLRGRAQLNGVAHLQQHGRHRGLAAVDREVAVGDHLPGLAPRRGEAQAVDDVIQPQLEQPQEVLARHALLALRPLKVLAELRLQHAVDPLGFLLLAELDAERRELAPVQPVLAGRVVAPLDRALVGEAARALEEQLLAFAPAESALRVAVSCHRPPPTPAAASAGGTPRS